MRRKRRTIVRSIPFLLLVFIVVGYALFNTRVFLLGPSILIESPKNGASFFDPRITIEGNVEHIKTLYLDDRAISISGGKNFKEKLLLLPGYNIITIRGVDAFGRTTTKILELVLLENLDRDRLLDSPSRVEEVATSSISTSSPLQNYAEDVTSNELETSTTTPTLE